MRAHAALLCLCVCLSGAGTSAKAEKAEKAEKADSLEGFQPPPGWTEPYAAHRVIGNLHAVGMKDLSVFLITSADGHILINTGLRDSTTAIRENIETLGFRLEDVRILLTMQAHFDHIPSSRLRPNGSR